jgi:hypothetical protein
VALADCRATGGPSSNGPLLAGGGLGSQCQPTDAGALSTVGLEAVKLSAGSTVHVDAVELARPDQLQLVSAVFVPITRRMLMGGADGYPPPESQLDALGVCWPARRPAHGAVLAASGAVVWNLVAAVRVAPGATQGSADAFHISYTSEGRRYRASTSMPINPPKTVPATVGPSDREIDASWRDAGAVERGGLENR